MPPISKDLHPADLAARVKVRDRLRDIRKKAGWTQAETGTKKLETSTSWRVSTLQYGARALRHRILFELHGVMLPEEDDILGAIYGALNPANDDAADALHLLQIQNQFARARTSIGLSYTQIAKICGISRQAAAEIEEEGRRNMYVSTLQRSARVLGGRLSIEVLSPGSSR